jgi:hypothetical protein
MGLIEISSMLLGMIIDANISGQIADFYIMNIYMILIVSYGFFYLYMKKGAKEKVPPKILL